VLCKGKYYNFVVIKPFGYPVIHVENQVHLKNIVRVIEVNSITWNMTKLIKTFQVILFFIGYDLKTLV